MIDHLGASMQPLLPLKIHEAEWNDPALTISGSGWSISTTSSWRVVENSKLVFGWSQPDAADLVWDLCGKSIVDVGTQSSLAPVDPVLHLSDGSAVEIFSDNATDPWVIRLPGVTIVGDPTG